MKKVLTVGCCAALALVFVLGAGCGGTGGAEKEEFLGLKEGEEFTTDTEISITLSQGENPQRRAGEVVDGHDCRIQSRFQRKD